MAEKALSWSRRGISWSRLRKSRTASSSSRRGTCLLARSAALSNLIKLSEQDFFTWRETENSGRLITEIVCVRQGFRHWTYGNHHAQVRILCRCRTIDFVLSFVQARIKVQDDARIDPRIITCICSIGEWWRTPVLMPTNEDSEPEILQVKFRLLLKWCSLLCFSCCVCGVCMWKFLLCDDNGEAYDVSLLLYEVDGGFYDIGDHPAGCKLAYDGPG